MLMKQKVSWNLWKLLLWLAMAPSKWQMTVKSSFLLLLQASIYSSRLYRSAFMDTKITSMATKQWISIRKFYFIEPRVQSDAGKLLGLWMLILSRAKMNILRLVWHHTAGYNSPNVSNCAVAQYAIKQRALYGRLAETFKPPAWPEL